MHARLWASADEVLELLGVDNKPILQVAKELERQALADPAGSGFTVRATPVPGSKVGLFVYTTQGAAASPLSLPFGWLCIAPSGVPWI